MVKFQGGFVWHKHVATDKVFIVVDGEMSIEFRDGKVDPKAGRLMSLSEAPALAIYPEKVIKKEHDT